MSPATRLLHRAEAREESARAADAAATVAISDAEREPVGSASRLFAETVAAVHWAERNHDRAMARLYREAAEKARLFE